MVPPASLPQYPKCALLIGIGCFLVVALSCGSADGASTKYPTRAPSPTAVEALFSELDRYIGQRVSVEGVLAEPENPNTLLRCDNTDDWHKDKYLCHWFHLVNPEGQVSLAVAQWTPDLATQRAQVSRFTGGLDWLEEDHILKSIWLWDRNWNKIMPGDGLQATGLLIQTAEQKGRNIYFMVVELIEKIE